MTRSARELTVVQLDSWSSLEARHLAVSLLLGLVHVGFELGLGELRGLLLRRVGVDMRQGQRRLGLGRLDDRLFRNGKKAADGDASLWLYDECPPALEIRIIGRLERVDLAVKAGGMDLVDRGDDVSVVASKTVPALATSAGSSRTRNEGEGPTGTPRCTDKRSRGRRDPESHR